MTALLINLRIDNAEKLNLFKKNLSKIQQLFSESHIKIRGRYSHECINFSKELKLNKINFYQELQEKDWADATLQMIDKIKSRSIFFFLEDHALVNTIEEMNSVLKEFDEDKLDYLCYSFFKASRLNIDNLLPLNPSIRKNYSYFILDEKSKVILSKISPLYYIYSSASICSKDYLKSIIKLENKTYKIYFKKLSSLLSILFPYPKYRIVLRSVNRLLSQINSRIVMYQKDAPFNMEKLNKEIDLSYLNKTIQKWKIGILKNELFANFDDDNNAYGESLIKKGLYPTDFINENTKKPDNTVDFVLKFKAGDIYNCKYFSQIHRITSLPKIFIQVKYGKLDVDYKGKIISINTRETKSFYTNIAPIINCVEDAEIEVSVYDECFSNIINTESVNQKTKI